MLRPPQQPHPPRALQLDAESEVNNEMANRMSLFYAEATPMLKTLSNATTKFVSEVSGAGGALGGQKARSSGAKPPPAPAPCGDLAGLGGRMCPPWELGG